MVGRVTFCFALTFLEQIIAAESIRPRLRFPGDSFQSDIQKYLRSITQQNPLYGDPNFAADLPQPKLQYPAWRPPIPADERIENPYDDQELLPRIVQNERLLPTWSRVPFQANIPNVGVQSYASSSAKTFNYNGGAANVGTGVTSYSSVKDVNAEEQLGEHTAQSQASAVSTINEPAKKSPQPVQQTAAASEVLGRKSDPSTSFQRQSTEAANDVGGSFSDIYFVAAVAGCSAVAIFGVVSAGYCFYRLQKSSKAAAEVDYPAYGVTGPSKDAPSPNGDRKLAQSAQMYHYQHQKQQMIAVEKAGSTKNTSASDGDSEEENEEGDYTVYECPGLAPTGEMEVKNPLFNDDSTPMSPPVLPSKPEGFQSK